MGKKKAAAACAAVLAAIILAAILIPAEAEDIKQPKKSPQPQSFHIAAGETEKEDPLPEESDEEPESEEEPAEDESARPPVSYEPEGMLLLEERGALGFAGHMQNLETSVRKFDYAIMDQSLVEVSFDWKMGASAAKGRSGIEFRDLYGRLIFAAAGGFGGESQSPQFFYSAVGRASISAQVAAEPEWTAIPYAKGDAYRVFFRADFSLGKISAAIWDAAGNLAGSVTDADIKASSLAKMTAAAYRAGTEQVISNLKLYGSDDAGEFPLAGKRAIAFGDSIVDGHLYKEAGFVEFLAEKEGMVLEYNYANNGARIMPGSVVNPADGLGGTILDCQVKAAANENRNPDYIIFDGGANDAYSGTDRTAFARAFRNTIRAMHGYWPNAKIVYVAVHKLSVRDTRVQEELRRIELSACREMGVEVADLYTRGWDTSDAAMNQKYAFDAFDVGHIPIAGDNPTGAHPNFLAIEELYVPVVSDAVKRAKDVTISDDPADWEEEGTEREEAGGSVSAEGDRKVESIRFPASKYRIAAGKKIVFEPDVFPLDAADPGVEWSVVSNGEYVSLDIQGRKCEAATKKSGAGKTVVLLAQAVDGSGVEKEITIKLMENAVTKVRVKSGKRELSPGEATVLKAAVSTDGRNANRKLAWTAAKDAPVILKPGKDGSSCTVTAKETGAPATVVITVRATDGTNRRARVKLQIK